MGKDCIKSEIADLANTIDKFLSISPDAPITIPLFSLSCRNLLDIHSDATGSEPSCVFYCDSVKVSVCLSRNVSEEEREAVKYFLSTSSSFEKELCIDICRQLLAIGIDNMDPGSDIMFRYLNQLHDLYIRIYNQFYLEGKDGKNDLADFLYSGITRGQKVYVPFASDRMLRFGSAMNEFVTADYCSRRSMAFDMYRPDNFPLLEQTVTSHRPQLLCRDRSQWFDRDEYDTILCELPENDYQAEYLVDKLLSVKYDRAFILVPATFLAGEKNLALRKKLSESGRLSEVLSLPDMGIGDYALITLDDNEMQVTSFVDAHGMYSMNKDQGKDDRENLEVLLEVLQFSLPELEDWQEQYIDFPSPEFRNNGYILNPKYYIRHTLSYEGEGEYEEVKLGDLLTPDPPTKEADGNIVYCNYGLAPANEFAKANYRRFSHLDASDEVSPVVDRDCLVCYFNGPEDFRGCRMLYWKANNPQSLYFDGFEWADGFVVDTERVDPDYLIHQLYRPETYLQIRQTRTLSYGYLGDWENCHPLEDIRIPLPKAKSRKDSLAIQKQIYERKKKIFACIDDTVTDLPDKVEVKTGLSPIVIDKNRNITFVDYNRSFQLPTKMFALYVFLMRTSVDERGNRIDITHKNIVDYHYEIGRIYYAVKRKLNDYRKILPSSFWEEYKINVKNIQDNAFSELINKTNKEIEKNLKGIVSDEIIEKYKIPSGVNKSRNVIFDAEISVDSGFPKDFFSESDCCCPDSHYPEEAVLRHGVTAGGQKYEYEPTAQKENPLREKDRKYYELIVRNDVDLFEISQNPGESHRIIVDNEDVRKLFRCKIPHAYDGTGTYTPIKIGSGAFARNVEVVKLYNPDREQYLIAGIRSLSYEKRGWNEFAVFEFSQILEKKLNSYDNTL